MNNILNKKERTQNLTKETLKNQTMENFNQLDVNKQDEIIEKIKNFIYDNYENLNYREEFTSDFHHEVFNQDYYIIGRYEAEKWLEEFGTFKAIEIIKNYENQCFGNVSTDFSEPEKVLNMLTYIIGEEICYELEIEQHTMSEILEKLENEF